MTLQPGQTVAHYRLLELIGEGGMGRVFRALDSRLQRQVAIKILLPALTADEKLRRRFLREARAAAAVSHPAIASVHEVGELGEVTYIVMEYVEGKTLRKTIDGRPLPLTEALRAAVEIGEGLTEAHKAGVIHRDLKPDNIIIRPDRRPKILDFGIAKLLEDQNSLFKRRTTASSESTSITGEGRIVGTLGYMSPEQARGDPVDARSDIFSFGVILYEMVAGQAPFRGRTPIDTLTSILKEPPPPVIRFNPKVHPRVEDVLQECLDKDPASRFQNMEDVVVALRITQLAIQEAALRRTTMEQPALKAPLPRPGDEEKKIASKPRSSFGLAAAAVVAAVTLILAGLFFFRGEPDTPVVTAARQEQLSMAVIGFENLTDPSDEDRLGRALAGLITTDLAERGGLRVASTAKVMSSLKKAGALEENGFDVTLASKAARIAGAEMMLLGRVTGGNDRLILSVEIVDVQSGNTVGSLRREAPTGAQLIELADAIAADVRRKLGVESDEMEGASGFDLARSLTSSPAAYRHYISGEVELHQARWADAARHLRRAVEEDPTFALAYYQLATAQSWIGRSRASLQTLEAGHAHVERLPRRWQVIYEASLQWRRGGQEEEAIDALSGLAVESPNLPDAHYLLGELHTHRSRYYDIRKARESFQRALDLDPTFKIAFGHLVNHYLDADEFETARALIEGYRDETGDDAALAEAEVALLFAEGDIEVALTLGEEAMKRGHRNLWQPVANIYRYLGRAEDAYRLADEAAAGLAAIPATAFIMRAASAADMGRIEGARKDYAAASRDLASENSYERYGAAAHVARARLFASTGDHAGAIAAVSEALETDPWYAPGFFWQGRILLEAGEIDRARESLAKLREMRSKAFSPSGAFWERALQAEIHRADLDLGSALQELGKAALLPPEQRSHEIEWMTQARVKAAFGDREGAIEAWRECIKPRVQNVSEINMTTPLPFYELALLEEEVGNTSAAREHYRQFLSRWGRTDSSVAAAGDARSRLEALDDLDGS